MSLSIGTIESLFTSNKKQLAVLIDPDKFPMDECAERLRMFEASGVDFLFIGGSLNAANDFDERVSRIRSKSKLPMILFPGNPLQLTKHVDATLFLSLISGRNAEYLIGHHVVSAPYLHEWKQEVIPTGYLLVSGGKTTTAIYISQTLPLPNHKPEVAAATALAGKYLGLRHFYLDTGSGAEECVSPEIIQAVKKATQLPTIVGGGIRSEEDAHRAWKAGADIVVLGTVVEENPTILFEIQKLKNHDTQTVQPKKVD
jgi:phosphoglycerol geranylgeranyltransferase